MKKAFFLVTLMMLLLLPVVGWAAERNIYLSDVADPLEDGTIDHPYDSWSDLPWSTISSWVAAGDDVYINMKRGSVWHGYSNRLQFKASGTPDHPITVRPYGTGAKPQIDEDGSTFCIYNYDGVSTYHDYWVIDGLDLVDWSNIAVNVQDCDGFVLKNCEIHNNTEGSKPNYAVLWYGTNGKIQNNYFHDIQNCQIICRINNNAAVDTLLIENNIFRRCLDQEAWADGEIIGLPGGTSSLHGIKHVVIRDNIFDTCSKAGANASITIYNSEDVQVLRNQFFNGSARCIQVEVASKDVYVAYNLVHDANFYDAQTATSGIFGILQATGGCTDCTTLENINIVNNTAYNIDTNNTTSIRCGIRIQCADNGSLAMNGIHIKNNIIYANMASDTTDCWMLYVDDAGNRITGLDFDYNDWYRSTNTTNFIYFKGNTYSMSQFATYQSTEGQDAHSFVFDPLLTPNYHLSAGSPCIDAGIKVRGVHFGDYWKDLDGNSTPWGDAPDIGCYEYDTGETGWAPGWFVRPAGGNYGDEDGTSYENAWDGFSNIVWGTGGVQAGDTLWICGTHNITSSFEIEVSGSSDNYVIIRMDYPSDLGLINGSDAANQPIYINQKSYIKLLNCRVTGGAIHGINIYNSNHILLIGCEVYGNARNGITISDFSSNVTIFSCKSHDNGTAEQISSGILISSFSNNINVTKCLLYQNGRFDSTDGRGITVQTGAHDVVISDCQMWNNGIGDGSGLEVYDADHVILQRCKIKGSVNAIEARGHDSTNYPNSANYLKVYYCLLEAEKTGILYGNYPADGGQECEYGEFYNNTIIVPRIGIDIYSPNNSIVNNIIKIPAGEYSAIYFRYMTEDEIDTCTQDYNYVQFVSGSHYVIAYPEDGSWHAYDTVASWHSAHPNLAEHDVIVDDLALLSNYHLSRNSPCIDAGTTISGFHETALDIDKQPILGTPDIGCDERKALWWDGRRWHMQRMYASASTPAPPSQAGYMTFVDGAGINFKDTGGITFQDL